MPWLMVALQSALVYSAAAFVVSSPRHGAERAMFGPHAKNDAHIQHLRGRSDIVPEVSATPDRCSFGATALAIGGLCGLALSVLHSRPRPTKRTPHQRHRAVSVRDEASGAGVVDLDSVETAMSQFVPKIAALQTQATLLRDGELSDVIGAMQDLRKPELQNVFMELDGVLSALVESIQDFKKRVITIRRSEIEQQVEQMEQDKVPMALAASTIGTTAASDGAIDTMMQVHVVGLSHHSAPVEIRERLSVPQADWNRYSQELVDFTQTTNGHVVPEVAVLSTCNRFEIYFSSKELSQFSAIQCVHAFLRHKSGLSREELEPYLFTHTGSESVHHLFEVASGLDSLVLGEAQILSQVKACHEHSIQKADSQDGSVVPGSGGKILARLLNAGIRMGKLARTRTQIGVGAVSVSSAAVELMMVKSIHDVRKYPENLHVCIVGAGKMSRLLLLALFTKYPDIRLTLVNRSVDTAQALLDLVAPRGGRNAEVAPAEKMWDVVRESDVVFTATSSTTPIICADNLRDIDRNLMLVDIAVPRNVASDCDQVDGVSSYSVDDLKKIQETNNKARDAEVLKVKEIIQEQAQNFKLWQHSQGAVPYIAAMQQVAEKVRVNQIEKASKRLKDLHVKEREAVEKLSRNIIDELFRPMYYSMKDDEHISSKKTKILGLKMIFGLEPFYKRNHDLLNGTSDSSESIHSPRELASVDA